MRVDAGSGTSMSVEVKLNVKGVFHSSNSSTVGYQPLPLYILVSTGTLLSFVHCFDPYADNNNSKRLHFLL